MPPPAGRLATALHLLAIRANVLFEGVSLWPVDVPETIPDELLAAHAGEAQWRLLLCAKPDALHALVLQKVRGLREFRQTFRAVWKLTNEMPESSQTAIIAGLIRQLLRERWFDSYQSLSWHPEWMSDGVMYDKLGFVPNRSCIQFVTEMCGVVNTPSPMIQKQSLARRRQEQVF